MKPSSLVWSFAQQATRQGLSACVFFAMAYMLEPAEFGTMTVLLGYVALGTILVDAGFGAAVVQRTKLTEIHLTSAFACNVVIAFVSFIAIWFLAPVISWAYAEPAMLDLLRVLALAVILSSLVSTKVSLANREMRFRQLAIRDSIAVVIGGLAGLSCALSGWGVWSLVVQTLSSATLSALVSWSIVNWRPYRKHFSWQAVREMSAFSGRMLLFGLIKAVTQNIDVMVIGYTMGLPIAGLYGLSSRMIITPMGAVRAAFGAYFFPAFSRLQDDLDILASEFEIALKLVGYSTVPLLLILYFAVEPIVTYALPTKWIDSIPVAKALTFVSLLQVPIAISGELMKAMGRASLLIWWSFGLSTCTAAAIGIASHWGLWEITVAIIVVHAFGLIVSLYIGVWLTSPTKFSRLFAAYLGPILLFLCFVAAGEYLSRVEAEGSFDPWVRLTVMLALFSVLIASSFKQISVWFKLAGANR